MSSASTRTPRILTDSVGALIRAELSFLALPTHLIIDLRAVDLERPDEAGEYGLRLTEGLVDVAVHAEVTVLEPGFAGALPAGDVLLLPAGGRPAPGYRCVTAIHHLPAGFRGRFEAAFAGSRSELVLAPSHVVAGALTGFLRVPEEKVAVVLPCVGAGQARTSREAAQELKERRGLPDRYLLAFGEASLAKRAWSAAAIPDAAVGLVLAGELKPGREELPALLSGAVAVLFAQPATGNGIRALDAMACGAPPIVADDGAFPEIIRDGGLTISASEPNQWGEAIAAVFRSPRLRAQLSARGRELAGELTAARAARAFLELLGRGERGLEGERVDARDLDRGDRGWQ